jgi:uncharacterized protein (UPF0212 family)
MAAFLEISILRCPRCGNFIAEPGWFVDLESEISCAVCKKSFVSKDAEVDRRMARLELDKQGKIKGLTVA